MIRLWIEDCLMYWYNTELVSSKGLKRYSKRWAFEDFIEVVHGAAISPRSFLWNFAQSCRNCETERG